MPTRFMRESPSGNKASRAGIGLVPIFFFQACGSEGARRADESSPTPSRVLLSGRSEIIVVIRFAASVIVLVRCDQGRLENRAVSYRRYRTFAFTVLAD